MIESGRIISSLPPPLPIIPIYLLLFALNEMVANQSEEGAAYMWRRTSVTRVDRVFRGDRHRPHPGGGGLRVYGIILRKMLVDNYRAG